VFLAIGYLVFDTFVRVLCVSESLLDLSRSSLPDPSAHRFAPILLRAFLPLAAAALLSLIDWSAIGSKLPV
jgi:hypothetical protein